MSGGDPLSDPQFPDRPEHPDFWRLSSIILSMDGKFGDNEAGIPTNIEEFVAAAIDPRSLFYMAAQRSLITARKLAFAPQREVLAASYVDGFLTGYLFAKGQD